MMVFSVTVKVVVQVRLFPDAAQQAALRATLELCNQAANTAPHVE
jgi:putative transposase